ncbi:MAG: hypothetical protein KDD42_04860 [Bdellovibrionales bacterium]|nr:hypothetical protein [Bdellovibrionales bacterium]
MFLRSTSPDRSPCRERGSLILLLAGLLPLISFTLCLIVDLFNLYQMRQHEKEVLSAAVLLGAKQLPYQDSARSAAETYVRQFSQLLRDQPDSELSIDIDADAITATLRSDFPLRLASIIFSESVLPLELFSSARVNSKDVVFFLDTSNYMAPSRTGIEFWSKEQSTTTIGFFTSFASTQTPSEARNFPAAQFFKQWPASNRGTSLSRRRRQIVYTQQCFSPPLMAMKQSAIRIYDYLANFSLNSIGILSGPDASRNVEELRPVSPPGATCGFSEARFINHSGRTVQERHCLAAAETANQNLLDWKERNPLIDYGSAHSDQWSLPDPDARYGFPDYSDSLGEGFDRHPCRLENERLTDPDNGALLPDARNRMMAREIIWSLSVNPNRIIGIGRILSSVASALSSASTREDRGGMQGDITSTAFIYLGDFPYRHDPVSNSDVRFTENPDYVKDIMAARFSTLNQLARGLNRKFRLYFILFRHAGIYPTCEANPDLSCEEYDGDFAPFEDFINENDASVDGQKPYPYLELVALRTPDLGTLAMDLASYLPLTERAAVLTN